MLFHKPISSLSVCYFLNQFNYHHSQLSGQAFQGTNAFSKFLEAEAMYISFRKDYSKIKNPSLFYR